MREQIMSQIAARIAASHKPSDIKSFLESIMQTMEMPRHAVSDTSSDGSAASKESEEDISYSSVRSTLTTRICDAAYNDRYLQDKPWTPCGPFAVMYRVKLGGRSASSPVTKELLEAWGVTIQQLHTDALEAERRPLAWNPSKNGVRLHLAAFDHHDQDPKLS